MYVEGFCFIHVYIYTYIVHSRIYTHIYLYIYVSEICHSGPPMYCIEWPHPSSNNSLARYITYNIVYTVIPVHSLYAYHVCALLLYVYIYIYTIYIIYGCFLVKDRPTPPRTLYSHSEVAIFTCPLCWTDWKITFPIFTLWVMVIFSKYSQFSATRLNFWVSSTKKNRSEVAKFTGKMPSMFST